MASFRLNIATVGGCPAAEEIGQLLADYGLPEEEDYGVLSCTVSQQAVFGTVVRRLRQAIQRLDAKAREITAAAVEKVQVYPFAVHPAAERLEVYAGAAAAIEQMGEFLGSCLALPTVVEPIEVDIPSALDRLAGMTRHFQLRSVRVSEYAHNSYMSGPYSPKFLDTEHGRDFLQEYAEFVTSANVRFAAAAGRVNVKLAPKACFSFSCHEEDRPETLSLLRKLA